MLQNDVIKCCKMMSPHSNEPATWRNCVSRRHFYLNGANWMDKIIPLSDGREYAAIPFVETDVIGTLRAVHIV